MKEKRPGFFAVCVACLLCAWLLIVRSGEISQAVREGCALCSDVIIPSLFPFLFLSLFIVNSGMAEAAGKVMSPLVKGLFKLPGCGGAVILTALAGGYPAGAQAAAQLYHKGALNDTQYQKLMCFCVCAGPAFLTETLGRCCFGTAKAGYILLGAQTVSCLLLGLAACRLPIFGIKKEEGLNNPPVKTFYRPLSDVFVFCARSAAEAMLTICSYVVIFTVVITVMGQLGISGAVSGAVYAVTKNKELSEALLPALLETSCGSRAAASAGMIFTSFAASFGGFCVHFQIFSFSDGIKLPKLRFELFRLSAGLTSAFFTWLLLGIFPISVPAMAQNSGALAYSSGSRAGSAALLLLCIAALVMRPNFKNTNKRLFKV